MAKSKLVFKQVFHAPVEQVYQAFTNSTAMGSWFADLVEIDARPGGRFYGWWNAGFYTAGVVLEVVQNEKVVFTWQTSAEPAPTKVKVTFKADGDKTKLKLVHTGMKKGEAWKPVIENFTREWPRSFGNLRSVLEKGVDMRLFSRPMLGFFIGGMLDEAEAEKRSLPIQEGMLVSGVLAGMGAESAGLKDGDVIYTVNEKVVDSFNVIGQIVGGKKPGDVLDVVIYRGAEKMSLAIPLSQRAIPDFPAEPKVVAEELKKTYAEVNAELDAALEGVTDKEASFKPAEDSWSAKEVLAHLIVSEIWTQFNTETTIAGARPPAFPTHFLLPGTYADTFTLEEMVSYYKKLTDATTALAEKTPDAVYAWKWAYLNMYNSVSTFTAVHNRQHIDQIKAAVEASRK